MKLSSPLRRTTVFCCPHKHRHAKKIPSDHISADYCRFSDRLPGCHVGHRQLFIGIRYIRSFYIGQVYRGLYRSGFSGCSLEYPDFYNRISRSGHGSGAFSGLHEYPHQHSLLVSLRGCHHHSHDDPPHPFHGQLGDAAQSDQRHSEPVADGRLWAEQHGIQHLFTSSSLVALASLVGHKLTRMNRVGT